MRFSIAVHGAPYSSQASLSAARFAAFTCAAGHDIHRIFFYHEGVFAANRLNVTPQEESDLLDLWLDLKAEYDLELTICIAAALKRGVLNEEERDRYNKSAASIHPAFEVVGLGQLIDAIIQSDRVVTFAA